MPDPLEAAPPRTIIRNIAWLVAWDETARSHVYRRDVDLTIDGDTISGIGAAASDHQGVEIDGMLRIVPQRHPYRHGVTRRQCPLGG